MMSCRECKQNALAAMRRVAQIYHHPLYRESLQANADEERDRIYCRHDMAHVLDVARLAYIFSLEREYGLSKDVIYGAALLHDIGRWQQYRCGIPHDRASAKLAERILTDTDFSEAECGAILYAIKAHRGDGKKDLHAEEGAEPKEKLAEVLYDGDKLSRACYSCESCETCNWSEDKKNLEIMW